MNKFSGRVLVGDVREILGELEPAQVVVTSPPYLGLRLYPIKPTIWGGRKNCRHEWATTPPVRSRKAGDHGGGKHAKGSAFDAKPTETCRKCGAWRGQLGQEPTPALYVGHLADILTAVPLRTDGVLFVNIKDTAIAGGGKGVSAKNWACIPALLTLEMQRRGWFFRQEIIWLKTNPQPESVKDRLPVRTEKILMFTRRARYFFNRNAILVPCKQSTMERYERGRSGKCKYSRAEGNERQRGLTAPKAGARTQVAEGAAAPPPSVTERRAKKSLGDVWELPTASSRTSHVAPMPLELPQRCILLASKRGDMVCDPFAGTGTTLVAAALEGRRYEGVDIDPRFPAFFEDAICRARNPKPAPPPPPENQRRLLP